MLFEHLVPYIFLLGGLLIGASIFWYLRLWERGEESRWDETAPEDRPRRQRRLPRLFLIGLVLCVLTGPLMLWFMLTGGRTSTGAPTTLRLEEILTRRLPETGVQQERHEELIEAIRGIGQRSRGTLGETVEQLRFIPHVQFPEGRDLILTICCLLLLAAGLILGCILRGGWNSAAGVVIFIGAIVVFASSSPQFISFKTTAPPVTAPQPEVALGFEHLATVGPFPSGGHVGDEMLVRAGLTGDLTRINDWAEANELGFLLLVGRSDRVPLGGNATARYGSNSGLAQARAMWVRGLLLEMASASLDSSRVIVLSSGPRSAGRPLPPPPTVGDRTVDIYACWASLPVQ
jgi:hypothetical protein